MKLPAAGFELVYRDELDGLERQNTRFLVLHTLTRTTDDGWLARPDGLIRNPSN